MSRTATPDEVIAFIASAARLGPDVDPDASLSAVGIDSLDFVDLLLSLETEYEASLPIEQMDDGMSLRAFAVWVSGQLR
ncbi:Acyl carrier protein [Devosia enhydra]|uniref:Acyl carrier protein n=1 Tax=Devosia enhydra TaxID=665118 RepID=A0A1K2HYZ2_9HYPH|nr:acyl carrier protein [Devosia enhydra]SFZ85110.1 Acyl carrier protein [Devosia enhydra]